MTTLERIRSGDTFQGQVLKGSIEGYCPECDLSLPLQVLVVDTTLNRQRVKNSCSRCGCVVIGYVRDLNGGQVLERTIHRKLRAALKRRDERVMEALRQTSHFGGKPIITRTHEDPSAEAVQALPEVTDQEA